MPVVRTNTPALIQETTTILHNTNQTIVIFIQDQAIVKTTIQTKIITTGTRIQTVPTTTIATTAITVDTNRLQTKAETATMVVTNKIQIKVETATMAAISKHLIKEETAETAESNKLRTMEAASKHQAMVETEIIIVGVTNKHLPTQVQGVVEATGSKPQAVVDLTAVVQ